MSGNLHCESCGQPGRDVEMVQAETWCLYLCGRCAKADVETPEPYVDMPLPRFLASGTKRLFRPTRCIICQEQFKPPVEPSREVPGLCRPCAQRCHKCGLTLPGVPSNIRVPGKVCACRDCYRCGGLMPGVRGTGRACECWTGFGHGAPTGFAGNPFGTE